jgi:DNA-binding CsgD family transcriptional regulator
MTEALALSVVGRADARRGVDPFETLGRCASLMSDTDDYQTRHRIHIALAEALWLDDRPTDARAQINALRPFHEGHYEPWRRGEMRLWCQRLGVDAPEPGAVTTGFDLHVLRRFREAAAVFEARGCPYEAADALGDSEDQQDLRRSLEILHGMGATARANQVTRRLRELGARTIPRGPRAATRAHGSGLTAREVEVADLLAQGLSNAQIADRLVLSPKTVDHHVSAVLAKLAVPTRRDVANALQSSHDVQPDRSRHA